MKEESVLQKLNSFFNRLKKNKRATHELKKYNKIIQFYVTDGEDLIVKVENGVASVAPGKAENPDLELKADTATYCYILNGELSPGKAWFEQKLLLGWIDRSKPYYPWFTRIIHWFSGQKIVE